MRISRPLATSVLGCITLFLASEAWAQNTMPMLPRVGGGPEIVDRGREPARQPDLLKVSATRPIVAQNRNSVMYEPNEGAFRIVFRVTSTARSIPFATIGYGGFRSDFVLDWRAVSSSGATCVLGKEKLFGVDAYSGGTVGAASSLRDLLQEDSTGTVATPTQANIISATFSCDAKIRVGDKVTVQIKFYALGPSGWRTAGYAFNELEVGANR